MKPYLKSERAFEETSERLYAYPMLLKRIKQNKRDLSELEAAIAPELTTNHKSFVSMLKPGMRITPDEAHEEHLRYLRSRISIDTREAYLMSRALKTLKDDPYYRIIELSFFRGMTLHQTAQELNCDASTASRNRTRLLKQLSVILFNGMQ